MGFFDSIIDGVKSAGGWALDHAGDIANVVGTVAKVAGAVALFQVDAGTTDDSNTHLKDFFSNFRLASDKLTETAKNALDGQATAPDGPTEKSTESTTNEDSITGIWKHPAPLSEGQPPLDMYQDLSKWLALLGVPASQNVDVAAAAAQAIFFEPDKASSGDEALIRTLEFAYTDPSGGWRLNIAHAYYPLPLGVSKEDYCWHSCVYGRLAQSQPRATSTATVSATRLALATTVDISDKTTQGTASWLVNATINWGNVKVTATAGPALVTKLGEDSGLKVAYSMLLGCSQKIQVQTGTNINPSTVRNKIVSAAAQVLSALHAGNDSGKANSGMPSLVPEVIITKTQIVFS